MQISKVPLRSPEFNLQSQIEVSETTRFYPVIHVRQY